MSLEKSVGFEGEPDPNAETFDEADELDISVFEREEGNPDPIE